MKFDMFGIGCVSLLLFKSLHIQGANTHESKEELVILTSNNLFPCFHKKNHLYMVAFIMTYSLGKFYIVLFTDGTYTNSCLDKLTFLTTIAPL